VSFLDTLATPVALVLRGIHAGLSTVLPASSGWAWGLSIVFLTITVRILLFPLFVKQIKSQRRMQELAPKIKVLQAKHKGDRETLNTELMKLYKDHGTNPISGCLPLILQLPVFFALFRVMNEFKPGQTAKFGLTPELLSQGAKAKVFGAPISSAFTNAADFVHKLGGDLTTVRVVSTIMIVTMGATTFLTQRQMMARNGAMADPQQQQIQKIMLYVLPLSFAVFGFNFPIGVLLYWLTTNLWSMGQQAWVIKRMPPVVPGSSGTPGKGGPEGKPGKGSAGGKKGQNGDGDQGPKSDGEDGGTSDGPRTSAGSTTSASSSTGSGGSGATTPTTTAAQRPPGARPPGGRNAGSRKNKSRKGGRR
jgi:YidC/Oxa1 family membrane protein insertase